MSDSRLDTLAESARNRGLKLVRSRVRTPGKRRFDKVGLTDASGKAILGMDAKGPTASPEEIEDYLRNLDAKDWGASLDVAVLPRKRKARAQKETRATPANDTESKVESRKQAKNPPPSKRKPPPKPQLREAKPSDAHRLVELIHFLGHEIDEKSVRKNLNALKKIGEVPFVATLGKQVVGLCGVSKRIAVHKPAPIGRISVLVVAKDAQDHGIGRMLVEAAEQWCRKQGCKLVEVTSNDRRGAAHAFYRHMGYERSSIRFFKSL